MGFITLPIALPLSFPLDGLHMRTSGHAVGFRQASCHISRTAQVCLSLLVDNLDKTPYRLPHPSELLT